MKQEEKKKAYAFLDVYIAALPENVPLGEVINALRREEIAGASSETVKREKYFVWQLLAYAISHSLGLDIDTLDIRKEFYGGWSLDGISLSLSHSGNALAVAISRDAVGVDIEYVHSPRSQATAQRVMTEEEFCAYNALSEEERTVRFIEIWTAKEAIFKSQGRELFVPREIDTVSESYRTAHITVADEQYIFSVATAHPESIRLFTEIALS